MPISLGLKEPRWVSMVALYFNEYDPANITPHFDIYAVDPETGKDRLMASVRHNGQLFRLVKFPPIKTPLVKVDLVNSIARLRTLTEVELYGPLSGREGTPGFVDPEGQNTYMGDFTRVDKRAKDAGREISAADGQTRRTCRGHQLVRRRWPRFWFRKIGSTSAARSARTRPTLLAEPTEGTVLGTCRRPGLYALRRSLRRAAAALRQRRQAVLPQSRDGDRTVVGAHSGSGCSVARWRSAKTCSSPTTTSKLVQLDLASGTIMKEVPHLGHGVTARWPPTASSLFFITDDGFLQCLSGRRSGSDCGRLPSRRSPIRPRRSIKGSCIWPISKARPWRSTWQTGTPRWTAELSDEFCRCPVVGTDKIVFGCRGGTLAVLDRATGKTVWSKQAESRFDYEPLLLGDQVLFFRKNRRHGG